MRPARPARWVAEARDTRRTSRRGSPDHGEWEATRASPESTTAVTPSMVTEVSATLVERITLRRGPGRTARSCSSGERSPWSGRTSSPSRAAKEAQACAARRISAIPGRKTSTSPSGVSVTTRRTVEATRSSSRSSRAASAGERCSTATSKSRPSERTDGASEEAGHRRRVERGRHDDELQIRARGLLEAAQQRQRQVALEVALVELVEHDHAHAGQAGLGDQPAGEQPLGDEAQPRPGPGHLLEADLPADRLAGPLPQLLGHAPRRHAGREPPRLEDDDLAVAGQAGREQRGGDAGGLAGAGRRLDDERPAPAQGRHDVGEDGVDGERAHAAF